MLQVDNGPRFHLVEAGLVKKGTGDVSEWQIARQPISGSTLNRRAGDSQDDGTIWAYRYRRARQ